jgi:adenine-specific DNA-methyltransferase
MSEATAAVGLAPYNRKYLGSKRLIRGWIADRILAAAGVPETFLDGFCGTGSLAVEMLARGTGSVVAVDNLRSNCVILRAAVQRRPGEAGRLRWALEQLGRLPPRDGYITAGWSGTYFTAENCRRMDAAREGIEALRSAGAVSPAEAEWLLACFLLAADRVANTLGQYDAYLKHIDEAEMVAGRHVRDGRVGQPFALRPIASLPAGRIEVLEADILRLDPLPPAEVSYLDPPYNGRQYCDNYHVLENLARWEKPSLAGKTRKFDRSGLRSPFSMRSRAAGALEELVARVRSRHLFLSYGSEGILDRARIEAILASAGPVEVHELAYPVFGNGAGVSRKRRVTELLFHVRPSAARRGSP